MPTPATAEPRISLLYVDDEPALLEIARLFLERTGNYSVSISDNPHDALKIISEDSFDAIISDYQMPGCDGISFLRHLRKIGNKTPFIIFTGKGREDIVIEALNEGADFYIQKGGDPKSQFAELSNKVRYAVTRNQTEEALLQKNEKLTAAEEELRSQLDEIIAIQHQLALSEEQYRAIFEHTEAPTVIIEEDTTISLANSAFAAISGYSPEEVIGRSWTDFVSQPDLDRMLAIHRQRRVEDTEPLTKYEFNFINRYGAAHVILVTVGMIPGTRQSVASFHDLTELKRREEALRESEERYRRIVDTSADGIWQLDSEFRIIYVNHQMAEMLGYSPEDMIGMDATSFIPPDEHADSEIRKINVRRGGVDHFERRFIRRDGSSLWTHIALTPIINGEGRYQGLFARVTNIGERKFTEESLLLKNTAIDSSSNGICITDLDGILTYVNPAFLSMWGASDTNEVLGKSILSLWTQEEESQEIADALLNTGSWLGEVSGTRKDGSEIVVELSGSLVRDARDAPTAMMGSFVDITKRKAAEDALRTSKEQLESLSNNIPDGMIYQLIVDVDGNRRFTYLSDGVEKMHGISQAEALRDPEALYDRCLDEDKSKLIEAEKLAFATLNPFSCEGRFRNPDGEIRWSLTRSRLKKMPDGSILCDGVQLDITDRKAAEEALQTANKKLQLLSSITRHDIMNKIMALQAYLDLTMPMIDDPILTGYLTEAEKAATAIQKQIEFTRIYENLGVHTPTWQPLSPLIEAIDHTRLPIHHDCEEFSVYADPMFEKVLQNLYDNTLRHAEGADCVRIRCEEEEDGGLIITWEDNGPGVPEELKERIFDKSFGKNTGFGLFLTREILAITGITITETGVYGEGARFEIRVPAGGFVLSPNKKR